MAEFNLKRRAGLAVTLPIGSTHKVVLHAKLPVHFIEIPDIHFNHGSPVVCLDPGEGLIHGLSHAFYHAKENRNEEMVIVGHADTSGEPEVNYPLSELRALGVKAILTGNQDDWKKVVKKAKVADYQRTLKSLNTLYFWDCDPGAVDGEDGPRTRRAVKGFQKEANSIFGLGLADDGVMGEKTWLAVLDVLRFLLSQGGVDLHHAYPFLKAGDGIYACGESFPVREKGNKNLVSKENRRVEIYFGPAGEMRPLDPPSSPKADLTAKECVLFDPAACTVIPFGLKSSLAVRHVDVNGDPIPGATARLLKADGTQADAPKVTDADGFVFWFGIEAGDYTVDFADA
jgi:hypothetical protein